MGWDTTLTFWEWVAVCASLNVALVVALIIYGGKEVDDD